MNETLVGMVNVIVLYCGLLMLWYVVWYHIILSVSDDR